MRNVIKYMLSFLFHPIVATYLFFTGGRKVFIKPRMAINKLKYLSVGSDVQIGSDSRFLFVKEYHGGHYTPQTTIGNHVSIGNRFSALSAAPIVIGDNCLIASDVLITSESHGTDPELTLSYTDLPLNAKKVVIGEGCWLGEKVSVMPGVELGERCIVASNSVVTKSFPKATMIGGIPAKVIKTYNYDTHRWEKNGEVDG